MKAETFRSDSESIPTKEIDWEQRRYEVAKDIYCRMIYNKLILNQVAEKAVMYANELIKQLKKNEYV